MISIIFAIVKRWYCEALLQPLNNQHSNITFTSEEETDGELQLQFMDAGVPRQSDEVLHSKYTKSLPTPSLSVPPHALCKEKSNPNLAPSSAAPTPFQHPPTRHLRWPNGQTYHTTILFVTAQAKQSPRSCQDRRSKPSTDHNYGDGASNSAWTIQATKPEKFTGCGAGAADCHVPGGRQSEPPKPAWRRTEQTPAMVIQKYVSFSLSSAMTGTVHASSRMKRMLTTVASKKPWLHTPTYTHI